MKETSDLCDRTRLARVIATILTVLVSTDVVVGGNIEIVRSGVAVSKWDNSVVAGNAANSDWSEDGGIEIDPSWITSGTKATYKFLIPETTLPGGIINLQVRIYGKGKNGTLEPSLYAGPENNRIELDSSLPEAEGETIAYSIPLSCLVEAEGSIPGNWLDITLDFGYLDWYDVKYVKVEYSVSGVEQEPLEYYQSILNASQTLWIFYDEAAKNWPHPVASTDGMEATFMAVIPGYKSVFAAGNPLASAILEILKLPKLYQGMKSTFEEFFAFTEFMQDCTVFFNLDSGNEASVAFNGMANLANVWKNAISDNGQIDPDEISDIDFSISDAIQKNNSLTNIICGEWSIGQNLKNILNNNADQGVKNCAKAGLVLLSPMIRFNPETGIEQSESYLPALNETLDSMRPVQLGSLTVTLNPSSGQWHLYGNSQDYGWQTSGATVNNIPPNTYTLEFSSVSGYITPTPRTITIGEGTNTQTVNYQQSGGETITLHAAEYANIYSDFPTSRNLYANFMSIYYNGIPDQYWAILLKFNLSGIPAGIGIGAIGRQVASQLAAIGLPWMQLIDFDVVEESNIASQGYFEDDLKRFKVHATADICHQINPKLELHAIEERFKRSALVGNCVFCCVDKIETRKHIWEAVKDKANFFVDGRMSAEVLRIITACDEKSRKYYPQTLFSAEQAQTGACTAKTTIYCANIAAGFMLAQFTKYLRMLPVDPDIQINLLASELNVGSC